MATIKRAPSQTLVAFACHQELLRGLDLSRSQTGTDRSNFIRHAICAELRRRGVPVNPEWALAPDRAKKVRYSPAPPAADVSSAPPSVAEALGKLATASVQHPGVIYGRKRKAASPSGKTSGPASRARGR